MMWFLFLSFYEAGCPDANSNTKQKRDASEKESPEIPYRQKSERLLANMTPHTLPAVVTL
jgi:hypothetical protein